MEWFALLIPIITSIILLMLFRHKTVWWEFIVPFVVSLILIFAIKFGSEISQVIDIEYWGGWVVKAEYYERWDEEVPCSHIKYRTETRYRTVYDSEGNSHQESYTVEVFDGYEHIYDVDEHSPYWQIIDSHQKDISIDKSQFEALCNQFQNRKKIDMHRDYHSIDGDKFESVWGGQDERLEPVVTSHSYENRVQNSNSVFNFREIKKEEKQQYNLFEFPKIYDRYKCNSIFGDGGPTQAEANKLLNMYNAKLGSIKEIRMMILVFKNQPMEAGFLQELYWKRGNKNEFIITIGTNSNNEIQWAYAFSWTKEENLITEVQDLINLKQGKEIDLVKIVDEMIPKIKSQFIRRQFKEFKYINVDPPAWAMWVIFIVTIIVNGGLSAWIIKNEFEE